VSARWVAGSVRSQAMARRRLGDDAVRAVAASGTLGEAVQALGGSAYGARLRPDDDLAAAQRGVAETLLWDLRVLAGWLPAQGTEALRVLAGWFEIANVEEHLRVLAGEPADAPFRLGHLSVAWPRLAACGSRAEVRSTLAASAWGDPGGETPREILLGMRLAWAERVAGRVPAAASWARAATALLLARPGIAGRLPERAATAAIRLLGGRAAAAVSVPELAAALRPPVRWVLAGSAAPADLWIAEVRWWRRVAADAAALLAAGGFGPGPAIGAAALLAADARLACAALESAARGGVREAFDAVA
jgi:hypothetical protein